MVPGQRKAMDKSCPVNALREQLEKLKAKVSSGAAAGPAVRQRPRVHQCNDPVVGQRKGQPMWLGAGQAVEAGLVQQPQAIAHACAATSPKAQG